MKRCKCGHSVQTHQMRGLNGICAFGLVASGSKGYPGEVFARGCECDRYERTGWLRRIFR